MRTLLIRPPAFFSRASFPAGPRIGLPIGLLYLAAVLKERGDEVAVYDAMVHGDLCKLNGRRGPNMQDRVHFGASWAEIEKAISDFRPDLVGINNPYSEYVDQAVEVARIARRAVPTAKIVVGGPHVTAFPSEFLESCPEADIVALGEGEATIVELAKWVEGETKLDDVAGVAYRGTDGVAVRPRKSYILSLDEIPYPAYDLIDMERYFELERAGYRNRLGYAYPGSERAATVITSRGCPYRCVFCSIHQHAGRRWRSHSADHVLAHIQHLVGDYNIRHIHFEDDNFTLDRTRFEAILDRLIACRLPITWDTPNGIRADTLDRWLIEKARDSGCTYLMMGVESGDQRVNNEIVQKNLSLEKVVNVARLCREVEVDLHAFYMIGFPGETKDEIRTTLDFAMMLERRFHVTPHLNITVPRNGTRLHDICVKNGYLTEPVTSRTLSKWKMDRWDSEVIETPEFTSQDLHEMSERFHREMQIVSVAHALWLMVKHPRVAASAFCSFLATVLRNRGGVLRAAREVYLTKLMFANCAVRMRNCDCCAPKSEVRA